MSNKIQECLWKRKTEPNYYSPYKKREAIQRDFVRSIYGELFFVEALDLYKELEGHHGCVNSLFWSTKGDKLLSGSDDQTVRIWYPFENYSLNNHVIQTGHRGNIFSAKFMPHTSDSIIVTAAADSEIRIFDLNATSPLSHVYTCHSDPVKRIGINNTSPYEFLTCSEDGTVRHFDTRFPHICTPHIVRSFATANQQWSRHYTTQHRSISPRPLQYKCSKPLLDYSQYGLDINSMSVNKLRPHYFAIAGMDDYMYLHDMRMIGTSNADAQAGKNIDMATGRSKCVRRFRPTRSDNHRIKRSNKYVTACKFSDANGDELLGNWAGEGVYLFNIFDSPSEPRYMETTFQEPSSSKSHLQYFESMHTPLIDLHSPDLEDTTLPSITSAFASLTRTSSLTLADSKKSFYKLSKHYRTMIINEVECGLYPLALSHINDYYIELKYHYQLHLASNQSRQKEVIQLNHAWLHCMRAIIFANQATERIMSTEKTIEEEDEKNFIPYIDRLLLLKNSDEFAAVKTQMMKAKKVAPHNWRGLWCIATAFWLISSVYENMIPSQHRQDTFMDDDDNNNVNNMKQQSTYSKSHSGPKSVPDNQQHQLRNKRRNLKFNILTDYLYKVHQFSKQAMLLLQNEKIKMASNEMNTSAMYPHLQAILGFQENLKELSTNSKIALLDMVNLGDDEAKHLLKKIYEDEYDDEKEDTNDDEGDKENNYEAMSDINYTLSDRLDDDSDYNNNNDNNVNDDSGGNDNGGDNNDNNNNNNNNNNDDDGEDDDEDNDGDEQEKVDWIRSLYPPSVTWPSEYGNKKKKINHDKEDMDEDSSSTSSSTSSSSISSSDSHLQYTINVQEIDISDDDDDIDNIVLLHNLEAHHNNRNQNNHSSHSDHSEDEDDDDEDEDHLPHVSIGRRLSYITSGQVEEDDEDDNFFRTDEDGSDALDDLHGLNDIEQQQDVLRKDLEYEADVVGHQKKYTGHSNFKTIKDVNFYGGNDEYIVSGSDDGYCFIWDKSSTRIVQILQADQDIVNIVQGHPNLPIMAVSGIDDTIKIFHPTSTTIKPSSSSKMNQLAEVIQNNHQAYIRQRTETFLTRSLLESMTRASRRYFIITEDEDDDEDDDNGNDDNDDNDDDNDDDDDSSSNNNSDYPSLSSSIDDSTHDLNHVAMD